MTLFQFERNFKKVKIFQFHFIFKFGGNFQVGGYANLQIENAGFDTVKELKKDRLLWYLYFFGHEGWSALFWMLLMDRVSFKSLCNQIFHTTFTCEYI